MKNTIYLEGSHEGWIINLLANGVQIISPACGELEVEQINVNTVDIVETPNAASEARVLPSPPVAGSEMNP
jgi:hypothetical protein